MTNYAGRVELHRADETDYTCLQSLMESEGFVRWVEAKDGTLKRLPTAECNMADTSLTRVAALARAKAAANVVKPEPWLLVTESAGRSWSGLPPWGDCASAPPDPQRNNIKRRGIRN